MNRSHHLVITLTSSFCLCAMGLTVSQVQAAGPLTIGWQRQFGDFDDETGWDIAVDAADNTYVAGEVHHANLNGQTNAGGIDGFVVSLDSSGANRYTVLHGTTSEDVAFGIAGK